MEEQPGGHRGHAVGLDAHPHATDRLDRFPHVDAGRGGAEDEVRIRSAAEDGGTVVGKRPCEHLCVLDDLLTIDAVSLAARLAQDHAERGKVVHMQCLMPRVDDGGLHARGEILLREDDSAVGTAQGVARGEGDDIGERHRGRHHLRGDQSDALADVDPEKGIDALRDLKEDLIVDRARIAHGREDDEARSDLFRLRSDRPPVDLLRPRLDAVVLECVRESRDVILFPQVEGEHGVAGREERLKDDTRGGDDVAEADNGVVGVEQFLDALADDADKVQAARRGIVPPVKEAVCEDAALEVLRERRHGVHIRHEGEGVALTLALLLKQIVDLGVKRLQVADDFFTFHGQFSSSVHLDLFG